MRSFLQVLLCVLICVTVVTAMIRSNPRNSTAKRKSKNNSESGSDCDDDEVVVKESSSPFNNETEEEASEYFSPNLADIKTAWNKAAKLANRDPKIWRKDKRGNVILSKDYTISSPLAYRALVKNPENKNLLDFEAVQEEYYGEHYEDNHANGLKYKAKDQNFDDLLSLFEIAFNGNVNDEKGGSYCWVPSKIHQDLFSRHDDARIWHMGMFNNDAKFGMAGHKIAFQQMGVDLKDIRHLSEKRLSMNLVNTSMYIHNFQYQCSEVVSQIHFEDDPTERAKNIKNNWGLPLVAEFVETKPFTLKPGAGVISKSKLNSNKSAQPASSNSNRGAASKSAGLSDQDWPSLTPASGNKSKPSYSSKLSS